MTDEPAKRGSPDPAPEAAPEVVEEATAEEEYLGLHYVARA